MGLFKTNKKEVKPEGMSLPSLPELPKLPDFPSMEDESRIHQLPSFPDNSLGKKFSQNTIKDAISGEEEEEDDMDSMTGANEFAYEDEDMQRMREPLRRPFTEEMEESTGPKMNRGLMARESPSMVGESMMSRNNPVVRTSGEPVFVRIDKFEEALRVFNETKKKLGEIERLLDEARRLRDKEDSELDAWESEIKSMRNRIEKVDKDIFSKI